MKTHVRSDLGRRGFIAGLGAAAAASPFLPLMNASGAEGTLPRRLLMVFFPHGTIYDRWKPTGSVTDFQLSPILAPLERHKSKITVLAGVDLEAGTPGAPHTRGLPLLWSGSGLADDGTFDRSDCSGGCTYGWNRSASVDQIIAEQLDLPTAYKTLQFGLRCGRARPQARMIYTGAAEPVDPEIDPWAAYGRLFADGTGQNVDAQRDVIIAERRSMLDAVSADLLQLQKKAPSADRPKIEAHLQSLRNIELRLDAGQVDIAGCAAPVALESGAIDPEARPNTPVVLDAMFDLITASLACDHSRIVSFQYAIGDTDGAEYTWLGHTESFHMMTHDYSLIGPGPVDDVFTWRYTKLAELLDRLDAVPEGDGTLLDNTLVVAGSELGNPWDHNWARTPFVLAGGGQGAVPMGRFLDFNGVQHNRLLVSMCHAMGATNIDKVGDLDRGSGPLPGLLA